jgi:hypothetical protein
MPDGRVLIATSGNPWAATPTWTRYDELPNCRCAGWEMTTGRSSVFEVTDVGSATVHFQDRNRTLDTAGLIGRAIQLQIKDPVTGIWQPSFRGTIDEATHDVYPLSAGLVSTVQLRCVDMFAWLGRVEMMPGEFGHDPAKDFRGMVTFGEANVDDRIRCLLYQTWTPTGGLAHKGVGIPPEMTAIFSGNVVVWDTPYDPGESALTVLRDAADAEWPGVANVYVDRKGRIAFHGRMARFDPDNTDYPGVEWDFMRWNVGDSTAVAAGAAQVRQVSYSRQSSLIYNAAVAWPRWIPSNKVGWKLLFPEKQKEAQKRKDQTSIDNEGYRAMPPMGDLLVKSNFNNGNSGTVECQKYADYFVQNYKTVHKAIQTCVIKSVRPTDARAAATWAVLTRLDISDIIHLSVAAAGLSDAQFDVEGLSKEVRVLTPEYDYVELTPNLSSRGRYTYNPF